MGYGDTNAYKAVLSLNDGDGPYETKEEQKVIPEKCINHVSKRLGSRMRGLKLIHSEPVKRKSGSVQSRSTIGGVGYLTEVVITNMSDSYSSNK